VREGACIGAATMLFGGQLNRRLCAPIWDDKLGQMFVVCFVTQRTILFVTLVIIIIKHSFPKTMAMPS
jgi:hypothetical protein